MPDPKPFDFDVLNQPTAARPAAPVSVTGGIICPNPNCGYRGPAKRKARGSIVMGLILCCLFLLPGILYFVLRGGYRSYCPNCGLQVGNDN